MTAEVSTSPKWHKLFKVSLFVLIPLALLGGFFVTWFGSPLIPSSALRFTYKVNDKVFNDGRVFRPLGHTEAFYLHLPHTSEPIYRWILVRPRIQRVSVPVALYTTTGGLHYVHADQIHGVALTDAKIEDQWHIRWQDKTIQFTNGRLAIDGQFTR